MEFEKEDNRFKVQHRIWVQSFNKCIYRIDMDSLSSLWTWYSVASCPCSGLWQYRSHISHLKSHFSCTHKVYCDWLSFYSRYGGCQRAWCSDHIRKKINLLTFLQNLLYLRNSCCSNPTSMSTHRCWVWRGVLDQIAIKNKSQTSSYQIATKNKSCSETHPNTIISR